MSELKSFVHDVFGNSKSRNFIVVNDFLAFVTLLSVVGIILETVDSLSHYEQYFLVIEYFSVAIFTLEYCARILTAPRKLDYIFSFFGFVDLLSIVPTYFNLANLTFLKSVRLLRILRFLRVVRLAKISRMQKERVMHSRRSRDLYILNAQMYFISLFTAVTCWGSLIYVAEGHQEQFRNIPLSMIWAIKIIMGGVPNIPVTTLWGEFVLIGTRFTGLILLGLLIHVVGSTVTKLIFGSEIKVKARRRNFRK